MRRSQTFLARTFLAAALSVAAAPPPDRRPPVELLTPAPIYPVEAQGSGIDPEVTVEVLVDAQGRVEEVEVVGISPSSAYDPVFSRAVEESLHAWRYAPRVEAGQPVEARLRWTLEFLGAREPADPIDEAGWWDAVLRLPRPSASLLTLPREQREALLREQMALGVGLLDSAARTQAVTDRFVVHSDAGGETAQAIAHNLEAVYQVLDGLFAVALPPQPEDLQVQVFAFARSGPLPQLASHAFPAEVSPPAFYSTLGLIGMHLELPTPAEAIEVLLHEGTHAYLDRRVVRPGVRLPYWLNEGFAEYMANSTITKGRLQPGRVPRALRRYTQMVHGEVQVRRTTPQAALSLDEVKRAVRRGQAITLAEMLDADRDEFYGERLQLYYGMSWLLVHFLRHGEQDWSERAFPTFLLYAGEGYPVSAALTAAYGREPGDLEPAFRAHVAEL